MKPIDLQDSFSKAPLVAREQHIQQSSAEIAQRHLAAESAAERELDRGRPVAAEEVQVAERGTSVVFELPGTSTVPSDRRSYKLPIMSFTDDKPGISFESTPKLLRYVYLKCKTTNKTRFPLLAA